MLLVLLRKHELIRSQQTQQIVHIIEDIGNRVDFVVSLHERLLRRDCIGFVHIGIGGLCNGVNLVEGLCESAETQT